MKDKISNKINSNVYFIGPDYKSVICFSESFRVCSIKKFNWLQKKMLKVIFGIEVLDYEKWNKGEDTNVKDKTVI